MIREPNFQPIKRTQSLALLAVALIAVVTGTWLGVRLSTNHLLFEDATSTASSWADHLTRNLSDLEQIAAGESPSTSSMAFFKNSLNGRHVFRYEIYDRHGFTLLVAEDENIRFVDISDYNERAHNAIRTRTPIVDVNEGTDGLPRLYGRAFYPVFVNDLPIAVVSAYVDVTDKRDRYSRAFLVSAVMLCTLVSLAFSIPAIAWYRRTQEKEQSDKRIYYLAHHDALTGMLNRNSLMEIMNRLITDQSAVERGMSVHFIDIDRFKTVNDTLGHDRGDILLKKIATRLQSSIGANDVAARLGGDEFVVLQIGSNDRDESAQFAQRLVSALGLPMSIGGQEIISTISIGVALAPEHGETAARLLKSADLALYKAKNEGRDCVRFYSPEMEMATLERIRIEKTVREAVTNDRLLVQYQPIFAQFGNELAGFEALVRLQDVDGTLISPESFIPVAEDIRIIDKIGAWVLQEACRTAAQWPNELAIAVNLSPVQFVAGDLCDVVAKALQVSELEPSRLELEITESLFLNDTPSTLAQLQQLKEMGIVIVMDDFGRGYSSLGYLWRFAFDKIKVDRSFIANVFQVDRSARTVLKSIIALGRELGTDVTIEGVETVQQLEFLKAFPVDLVQGNYFGHPCSIADLAPILMNHTHARLQINKAEGLMACRKSA